MTYDDLVKLALELPDTEEFIGKKELAVNRSGKMMFRTRPNDSVAIRLDWDSRDRLLEEQPDTFFLIDHYLGWPFALARLEKLEEVQAKELLLIAWEECLYPCKTRPHEKQNRAN